MTELGKKPANRADLFAMAQRLRRRQETLYTLGNVNDPWMADVDYRSKAAHWAAVLFERMDVRSPIHIRQIHYRLVSQGKPVLQEDGDPYLNNSDCFNHLCDAIRDARYLGLIPTELIIDRRNPEPTINFESDDDVGAEIEIHHGAVARFAFGRDYRAPLYGLPRARLVQEPSFGQRYQVEIWIEKSTANGILDPLGEEYGVNVQTFIGEATLTKCKDLVDRAIESGRPVRILHVTDFDPAGRDMPISAAVKIDFMAMKSGVDLDIRLEHVALTPEQCIQYRLPRTPIKKTEGRAAGFEAQYGEGATELDAFEALHPGVLRQILVDHIERYRDNDLDDRVEDAVEQYRDELDDATQEIRHRHAEELADLDRQRDVIQYRFSELQAAAEAARAAIADPAHAAYDATVQPAQATYEAIVAAARRDLDAIVDEAQGRLAPLVQQADDARDEIIEDGRNKIVAMEQSFIADAEPLITQINEESGEVVPDPDQFDWPEPAADEWDNPLYDSTRTYVEQVDVYRTHRGDDEDVGLAIDRMVNATCEFCGKSFSFSAVSKRRKFCTKSCTNKSFKKKIRERRDGGPSQSKEQQNSRATDDRRRR